jgi:hypothetical protein
LSYIHHILYSSLKKTLANKKKTSSKGIIRKFGPEIRVEKTITFKLKNGTEKVSKQVTTFPNYLKSVAGPAKRKEKEIENAILRKRMEEETKKEIKRLEEFHQRNLTSTEQKEVKEERKFPTEAIKLVITNKDPLRHIRYSKRTMNHLDLKECPICQQKTSKHNPIEMHHLNALKRNKNTNYSELIAALNAKQLPMCRACHKKIHSGKYSGENLREIYQNLPKVKSD